MVGFTVVIGLYPETQFAGFEVSRFGTCSGYSWEIEWVGIGGDQPEMRVDGLGLYAPEVQIAVSTQVDGGTWLRPLRGDMLRVTENLPQVKRP